MGTKGYLLQKTSKFLSMEIVVLSLIKINKKRNTKQIYSITLFTWAKFLL